MSRTLDLFRGAFDEPEPDDPPPCWYGPARRYG